MDYLKEQHDFFNKMPCIVNLDSEVKEKQVIDENDRIVKVVKPKRESCFTVYYFHRIYNDDRIYKCKLRFIKLPEVVKRYMKSRKMREYSEGYKWDGPEVTSTQLSFF